MFTPYITIYVAISLPKILKVHFIYIVLAIPKYVSWQQQSKTFSQFAVLNRRALCISLSLLNTSSLTAPLLRRLRLFVTTVVLICLDAAVGATDA